MHFGSCGNPSEHFQKIVKLGKVFVVAPGSPEESFINFWSIAGVYRSTRIAWTGPLKSVREFWGVYRSTKIGRTGLQMSVA